MSKTITQPSQAGMHAPIKKVAYPTNPHPVERSAARLFERIGAAVQESEFPPKDALLVYVDDGRWDRRTTAASSLGSLRCHIRVSDKGTGEIASLQPALLYAVVHMVVGGELQVQPEQLRAGLEIAAAFSVLRPHYDYVLTQNMRSARNIDPERHIEFLARSGFTHVEVNALSTHVPLEPGVPNEYYSQFYSYCAALSQFVDSPLTKGIYPTEYLAANLNRLTKYAEIGRRYGLKPGILCFEPRTMPEHFFRKYPTLRGARVDHPFRSHLPRYTLAQDHPATREHYRIMLSRLMEAVPDLDYMSVFTNDSGAGFEHTASLYVGRNGGPYMIREWRNHEKIAEAAGNSITRWLRLLRDTAAEVNPNFEVVLRIEPFKVEHEYILRGMGDGVTVEAPSLLVRGYHLPYSHARYPEQDSAGGSIFHLDMDEVEKRALADLRDRGIEPYLSFSAASGFNMEPLLGIPFPRMLHTKLAAMRETGIRKIGPLGGLLNTEATPYWPHPDVLRAAQLTPKRSVDDVLHAAAAQFAGEGHAPDLVALWDRIEDAVSYLPLVPLYSNFGFVWMRTWVRPMVPDIEAIPVEQREYYERFLVSTPNNPAINDLGRDVLFDLITEESGARMMGQLDENALPRIDAALKSIQDALPSASESYRKVLVDLRDRVRGLKCWATTQRNTCAWVAGVHGYVEAGSDEKRSESLRIVLEMVSSEIRNARDLLNLWNTAVTEFILVSDIGETSYIYGENIGDLIEKKIQLMEQYGQMEPRIDREIMWRLV